MSPGVSTVLGWRPDLLDEAASWFEQAEHRLREDEDELGSVRDDLAAIWEGGSGKAARDALAEHLPVVAGLAEALELVSRSLRAAAGAFDAARELVRRARDLAEDEGLVLNEDGTVPLPAPVVLPAGTVADPRDAYRRDAYRREVQAEVAVDAQRLAREGLAAAEEADADVAYALEQAWQLTTAQLTPAVERGLVEQIVARELPAADTDPASVQAWWESLSPAAREAVQTHEWQRLGNLDGIPYDVRIRANRLAISAALQGEVRREPGLARRVAELEEAFAAALAGPQDLTSKKAIADLGAELAAAREALTACREQSAWYQELLGGTPVQNKDGSWGRAAGRQVVLFDPAGGRFGEVVGDLATATSVCLYVPGTGSVVGPRDGSFERASDFVNEVEPLGSVAVVTFIGGPMPQSIVPDATRQSYALVAGPRLARFFGGLTVREGASVTVLGHSYGGSVVGAAEVAGMRPDRVLHVESAGMGPGVHDLADLPHPGTERFSITAPGDPIAIAQGAGQSGLGDPFGIGHGDDPDTFPGVTRIDAGRVDASDPGSALLSGPSAHSDVFLVRSSAWWGMVGVITGTCVVPVDVP